MKRYVFAVVMGLAIFTCTKVASEELTFEWDWTLGYQTTEQRNTAFFIGESGHQDAVNALLDVQVNYDSWVGLFALYSRDLYVYQHGESQWWSQADHQFLVRELAWLGEWHLGDTTLDVSLGKLRVDWGVGYGYRVLDLFKPYRQNPVGIVAEEGAGVMSISHYDESGEWTFIATDSSWGQMELSNLDQAAEQQGFGVRRYILVDDNEYQWIGYYDNVRRGLVGGSVVTILDESTSVHSSALWQKHSVGYQIHDQYQPVSVVEQDDAFQALLGINWANQTGHNIIAEYWYDSRAWSRSQWQQAINHGDELTSSPDTSSLANSYAQGFQHSNLVQHNLMFHWRWDLETWVASQSSVDLNWMSRLQPSLDVMVAAQDGGAMITPRMNYQWLDTGDQSAEVEVAARFLTGDSQSAYAQINDKTMIVLNIKGKF